MPVPVGTARISTAGRGGTTLVHTSISNLTYMEKREKAKEI